MFLRHENGCVLAFQATLPTYFHLHLPQKNHEINMRLGRAFFWVKTRKRRKTYSTYLLENPEVQRASLQKPILWSFYCNRQETVLMSFPNALWTDFCLCPNVQCKERKSNANFYYTVVISHHTIYNLIAGNIDDLYW